MKLKLLTALLGVLLIAASVSAAAKPGSPAPAFTLADASGNAHSLRDHAGKWVVLEWVNFDCPFVRRHYGTGSMQALQKTWREKGVIWLSINSSATGKQGHFEGEALRERIGKEGSEADAYLVDTDGKVGRAYGARATPHMFVIDPAGKIVYAGAIDDKPTTRAAEAEGAVNYVSAALEAGMAGKPVKTAATTAYGCAVKY